MTKMEIIYLVLSLNYLFTLGFMYMKTQGLVPFLRLSIVSLFMSIFLIPTMIVDSVLSLVDIRVYLRVLFLEDLEDSNVE